MVDGWGRDMTLLVLGLMIFLGTHSIGILATLFAGVFFSKWLFGVTVLRRQGVEKLSI